MLYVDILWEVKLDSESGNPGFEPGQNYSCPVCADSQYPSYKFWLTELAGEMEAQMNYNLTSCKFTVIY